MGVITDFTDLLTGQVGKGIYVWGGDGENLSEMADPEAWIKKHETSDYNANRALKLYAKRVAAGVNPIQAFDCSGLVFWALNKLGLQKSDVNSRGLYGTVCTPIAKSELRAGDLVFCYTDKDGDGFEVSEIYHVGAMIDGTYLVECQGRDVGVVKSKLSSKWQAYGRPKAFADIEDEPAPDTPDGYYREIRVTSPYMRGDDVKWVQTALVALGYSVGDSGVDGIYGNDTADAVGQFQKAKGLTVDKIVGVITWSALATAISELVVSERELLGDADGDGKLSAADAAAILRSIVRITEALSLVQGDADNDGKVTAADASYVLRCVVGLEEPKYKEADA
ncbi:MAG: peptidoglycan-binding protein [Clostridia bacterium]|nr:peptidoglycan-binding protein [Clostridia bacterium]